MASDATRVVVDGTFRATIRAGGGLERVHAVQRPDGRFVVAAESDAGVDHVRFALGLDDDHSEFLRRFARDPLLGETLRRAVAGQLVQSSRARELERAIVRAATPALDGLHAPPTAADLGRFSPAQLGRLGLGARRAGALVRLCRGLDLEALKRQPTRAVVARLARERGLGPWSLGVVCLQGLGRYEHGLYRDLGLTKLASALWGRWVEPHEADELLAPYGEWSGLASVYLLAGFARGFVPLPLAA